MRWLLARWLRRLADRLDEDGTFRCASPFSFTLERGKGICWRKDGRGAPVWYRFAEYDRAHTEADSPL